ASGRRKPASGRSERFHRQTGVFADRAVHVTRTVRHCLALKELQAASRHNAVLSSFLSGKGPMTQTPSRRIVAQRMLGGIALATGGTLMPWGAAQAQFRVEISGVGATQIPIAIGAFREEGRVPQPLSRIVKAD